MNALRQALAFLSVFFQLSDIAQCLALLLFNRVQSIFYRSNRLPCFRLRFRLARLRGVLQAGTGFMQFFLRFTTLFLKLFEKLLRFICGLRTGLIKMIKQAACELLQQVQGRLNGAFLFSRHRMTPKR